MITDGAGGGLIEDEPQHRSQDHLERAESLAQLGSWEWAIDADDISWSSELFRIFGVDPVGFDPSYEAFLGTIHPEDRDLVDRIIRSALASHSPISFYHRIVRPDGAVRTLHGRGRVLVEEGRPAKMLGTCQDVTEAVEAEDALRRAEERFRATFEEAPIGMAVVSLEPGALGRLLEVNRAFGDFTANPPERLVGMSFPDLLHPADRAAKRAALERLSAEGAGSHSAEARYLRRDGRLAWGLHRCTVMRSVSGDAPSLISHVMDITKDKQAQEQLRASEAMYRDLVEASSDLMWGIDAKGRWTFVSGAVRRLYGYEPDEMIGRYVTDVTAPEVAERDREAFAAIKNGESVQRYETTHIRKDGSRVMLSFNAIARNAADGGVIGATGTATDVTERVRTEAELRHLADHDPLTGLLNRRRFEEELARQVAYAKRYGPRGVALLLDLDQFKAINDNLGHGAGDEVLRQVSTLLRQRLRSTDVIARLGGDEFAVLLPEADPDRAARVAGELLEAVRQGAKLGDGRLVPMSTSIGVAALDRATMTVGLLMAAADDAMYEAKEAGRDGFAVHDGGA